MYKEHAIFSLGKAEYGVLFVDQTGCMSPACRFVLFVSAGRTRAAPSRAEFDAPSVLWKFWYQRFFRELPYSATVGTASGGMGQQ